MAVRARRHDRQRARSRADHRLHVGDADRLRSHQHRGAADHPRLFAERHRRHLRPHPRDAAPLQADADAGPAQRLDQRDAVALDHHPRHGDAGAAGAAAVRRPRDPQLHRDHDVRRRAGRHLHVGVHRLADPDLSRRRHRPRNRKDETKADRGRGRAATSRICRAACRSTPTARAASASPACRTAARCSACRAGSGPGR